MTLMQLCKAALHISVFPCTMGGGGCWQPRNPTDQLQPHPLWPFPSPHTSPGDAAFLYIHPCSPSAIRRKKSSLVFLSRLQYTFSKLREWPVASKIKTVFPRCPVFQVRFVELLLLGPRQSSGHCPPHLLLFFSSAELHTPSWTKGSSAHAPHAGKTFSTNKSSISLGQWDTSCILHVLF